MSPEEKYIIYKQALTLVQNLMKDYGMSLSKAMEEVFNSDTFNMLCNIDNKMYNEGSLYLYNELLTEIKTGSPKADY